MTDSRIEEVFAAMRSAEDELAKGPQGRKNGTTDRIAREAEMHNMTVARIIRKLKLQQRIHICGWTTSSPRAAIWARGDGEEAPKPPTQTPAEKRQKYRERLCAGQAEAVAIAEGARDGSIKAQTLQTIERIRGTPQPWFAALPGASLAMKEAA